MARTVVLVVVCALLAAAATTPLPARSADVGPPAAAADVEILALDAPARMNVTGQSMDVASAVAMQRERARAELDRGALAVDFERAADEQARRELLFEAATEVEISTSELRGDERDLWASYVEGEIGTGTFLAREAVVRVRAAELREDLSEIRSFADEVPRLSMRSRLQSLEASLTGFDGPVTARATESITGETEPTRLYVSASANGTGFSTIDDDEYVREGFRSDNWVADSSANVGLDEVEARAEVIYPTAFNSSQTTSRGIGIVSTGIYRIEVGYAQGTIVAYMDGDTRDVFYEVQRRPLRLIQPGAPVTTVENGTRLTVNRTFAGGPLRVEVLDNRTGDPAEATVRVDDLEEETDRGGVVWTLMPAGETRITARTDAGTTTVVVAPTPPTVAADLSPSAVDAELGPARSRGTDEPVSTVAAADPSEPRGTPVATAAERGTAED